MTRMRPLRWLAFGLLALLAVLIIAGCPGGGPPLERDAFLELGREMAAIERMTPEEATEYDRELNAEIRRTDERDPQARALFLRGYLAESRQTSESDDPFERDYGATRGYYERAAELGSPFSGQASYRLGILAANRALDPVSDSTNVATRNLRPLIYAHNAPVWVRGVVPHIDPREPPPLELAGEGGPATLLEPGMTAEDTDAPMLHEEVMANAATRRLDRVFATGGGLNQTYYRVVDVFVGFFRQITPAYGAVLSLFFLAVVVKAITAPLTAMTFRGMRDMQRIQPLLKEVQAKYKDDRAKLAEEQMKLMKEHKVSPLGGCLPMLIQLPIFIVVYQAVLVYAYEFSLASFMWIDNLALPDLPLLILYAASMIVTQKLTTMPSADPQQQMIQKQMIYIMPLLLVFVLQTIASAFVLYWFFLNVLSAGHQYYLMRKFRQEDAAAAAPASGSPEPPEPPTSRRRKKGRS